MKQHFYTILILAAAIAAAGCGTTAEKEMPPPLVRTVTVGDASSTGDTGYAGTVRGRYETKLAFQVGGQILSRNVNVGTRVRAGDVLMVIDARDVQQKANAADAGVASARAQMQLARTNLARYEELYAAQAISAAALDQYRAQADAAEAAYRQAAAQSTEASNALGYTHLVAGADGVISNITVEEGQVVAAGQTVMTLTQEGAREIEIAVPESRLAEVSLGMPAAVSLWANQTALTGTRYCLYGHRARDRPRRRCRDGHLRRAHRTERRPRGTSARHDGACAPFLCGGGRRGTPPFRPVPNGRYHRCLHHRGRRGTSPTGHGHGIPR